MNEANLLNVLLEPHVSEKTSMSSNGYRQYAFKVLKQSTKPVIKQAIEKLFNVKVRTVNIVNVKSKATRFGRTLGRHQGWKKAYVTLEQGQELELK